MERDTLQSGCSTRCNIWRERSAGKSGFTIFLPSQEDALSVSESIIDLEDRMNNLFAYLKTLKAEEEELLDEIDLTEREREVLDLLSTMRPENNPTKEEACHHLEMSSSMFDKTCSILLHKAYEAIVPERGIPLLTDLHLRSLASNFTRELQRQEKEIGKRPKREKREFYRKVFNLLHTRFSILYNPVLAKRIAAILNRLDPGDGTKYYTQACLLGMRIWRVAAGEVNEKVERKLLTELEKLDRMIDPDTYPLARFRLNRNWAIFRAQINYDIPHRAAVLNEALQLCRKYPEQIPPQEEIATKLILAEHEYFFGENHRAAWQAYQDIFTQHPEELARQNYHRMKYLQLCLITGDYATVEKNLEQFESISLNTPDIGKAKGAALLWAKLSLYREEFSEAGRYIDLAFELNQKRFYVQYEIECRILQTAWFALKGDNSAVEALAPAHTKYLRSKGYYLKTSDFYPWFFKLVLAFIDERITGKPITRILEKKYEAFQKGAAAQYGELLRRMRSR